LADLISPSPFLLSYTCLSNW